MIQQAVEDRGGHAGVGKDGRIEIDNSAAERAATIYSLIMTAKLNGMNPQAWLTDVLCRIAEHPGARLAELRPWAWGAPRAQAEHAA